MKALTAKGVANTLRRGIQSCYDAEHAGKQTERLCDLLNDLAMSRRMDYEANTGDRGAERDADFHRVAPRSDGIDMTPVEKAKRAAIKSARRRAANVNAATRSQATALGDTGSFSIVVGSVATAAGFRVDDDLSSR